jgi:putative restriction endonuclease
MTPPSSTNRRNWDRSETLIAFNLYCRTPFGKLHARNPEIIRVAKAVGRTPDALAMKCCNLAALDAAQKARGIRGLSKVSRLDAQIWDEFGKQPEAIAFESESTLARVTNALPRESEKIEWEDIRGLDRIALAKVRINQHFFRALVLSGYREMCAICELPLRSVLVASHIVPWSRDPSLRMNPSNGICLCSTHDRAFDVGLFTISADYTVQVNTRVKRAGKSRAVAEQFLRFDGERLRLPDRWHPAPEFLLRHTELTSNDRNIN